MCLIGCRAARMFAVKPCIPPTLLALRSTPPVFLPAWEGGSEVTGAPGAGSLFSLPSRPSLSALGGRKGARRHARHAPAHVRRVASGRVSPHPSANLHADDDPGL